MTVLLSLFLSPKRLKRLIIGRIRRRVFQSALQFDEFLRSVFGLELFFGNFFCSFAHKDFTRFRGI